MSAETAPVTAKVFFILGGPGSGKGTNCERLVEEFGLTHISAGDLLRAAAKEDSAQGEQIRGIIAAGNIVPSEITVGLMNKTIRETKDPKGFLIDGFPRKFDQAQMFEEGIAKAAAVIYFDCSLETMEARLLARGAGGSGRSDDNIEAIRQRFKVNVEQCQPVVDMYDKEGRVRKIDSNQEKDAVYTQVRNLFVSEFGYGK